MENFETTGIYIHIPFCVKKCPYCDFTSFTYSEEEEKRYVKHLLREIELKAKGEKIDTIYLGGGTPSLVSEESLFRVLDFLSKKFRLEKELEVSIEVNPGTITKEKAKFWKSLGINRISIGAQSFLDKELKILGRIHSVLDIYKTFYLLREEDFNNINIDIMYALPFQRKEDFCFSIQKVVELFPEHISIYNLVIEEDTPFYYYNQISEITLPDNDIEAEMFLLAMEYLESNNYVHYEISNFTKNGKFKCKHNLKYWNQKRYLGFGVSAFSFDPPIRYGNSKDLFVYYGKIEKGILPIEELEYLEGRALVKDYLFLKFRLIEGVNKIEFKNKFGKEVKDYINRYNWFIENGLIEEDENRVYLTKKGILLANEILEDIL